MSFAHAGITDDDLSRDYHPTVSYHRRADHLNWKTKTSQRRGSYFGSYTPKRTENRKRVVVSPEESITLNSKRFFESKAYFNRGNEGRDMLVRGIQTPPRRDYSERNYFEVSPVERNDNNTSKLLSELDECERTLRSMSSRQGSEDESLEFESSTFVKSASHLVSELDRYEQTLRDMDTTFLRSDIPTSLPSPPQNKTMKKKRRSLITHRPDLGSSSSASSNTRNNEIRDRAFLAIATGNLRGVQLLVEEFDAKCVANIKDETSHTALEFARRLGRVHILGYLLSELLDKYPDLELSHSDRMALMFYRNAKGPSSRTTELLDFCMLRTMQDSLSTNREIPVVEKITTTARQENECASLALRRNVEQERESIRRQREADERRLKEQLEQKRTMRLNDEERLFYMNMIGKPLYSDDPERDVPVPDRFYHEEEERDLEYKRIQKDQRTKLYAAPKSREIPLGLDEQPERAPTISKIQMAELLRRPRVSSTTMDLPVGLGHVVDRLVDVDRGLFDNDDDKDVERGSRSSKLSRDTQEISVTKKDERKSLEDTPSMILGIVDEEDSIRVSKMGVGVKRLSRNSSERVAKTDSRQTVEGSPVSMSSSSYFESVDTVLKADRDLGHRVSSSSSKKVCISLVLESIFLSLSLSPTHKLTHSLSLSHTHTDTKIVT